MIINQMLILLFQLIIRLFLLDFNLFILHLYSQKKIILTILYSFKKKYPELGLFN